MTPLIKKLGHLCLGTPDLDRTVDFYCTLLECRVIHEFRNPQGERYGAFLLVGQGTFIEFFRDAMPKPSESRFRHLCFEVPDIQALAEHLRAAGHAVEVRRGRTDLVWLCYISDPDGNQVEFHQYDSEAVQYPYLS